MGWHVLLCQVSLTAGQIFFALGKLDVEFTDVLVKRVEVCASLHSRRHGGQAVSLRVPLCARVLTLACLWIWCVLFFRKKHAASIVHACSSSLAGVWCGVREPFKREPDSLRGNF